LCFCAKTLFYKEKADGPRPAPGVQEADCQAIRLPKLPECPQPPAGLARLLFFAFLVLFVVWLMSHIW
jgi:hypothetical protein